MKKSNKISTIIMSLMLTICLMVVSVTSVYAWFNGQGYMGKTMSYSRTLHIGSASSEVTNYYGYMDTSQNWIYTEIDPLVGFQQNNLIPGSFVHIRTDIENNSTNQDMFISLYLQDVVYDSPLHDFLYFGTTDPTITREMYKSDAEYNGTTDRYTLRSIPLITNYTIQENETVSLYWYIYIDSDAGMAVADNYIDFGNVILTFN